MQLINTEYSYVCAQLARGAGLGEEELEEQIKLSEEYRRVISALIRLPGIVIEVVGNWIWVTQNTFPVRKELKAAGLFFASKKHAWYYRSPEFKTRGGNSSLDEIRNRYGCETIHNASRFKSIQ